eukprot:COSAG06_NODE_14432_length_1157_cov_0.887524_1_plen_26_part_10
MGNPTSMTLPDLSVRGCLQQKLPAAQ